MVVATRQGGAASSVALKSLTVRQSQLKAELEQLQARRLEIERDVRDRNEKLTSVSKQIKELTSGSTGLTVSEHAILRYIERVNGIPMDELHRAVLPESVEKAIMGLGRVNGTYPADTHRVVVKNGAVVTILT